MSKNWTVAEVTELYNNTVIPTFAGTDQGQAQLNRIAKAITNESLDKRLLKQQETHAKTAFDKLLAKFATQTPEKVADLVARKDTWISDYITRKYGNTEE